MLIMSIFMTIIAQSPGAIIFGLIAFIGLTVYAIYENKKILKIGYDTFDGVCTEINYKIKNTALGFTKWEYIIESNNTTALIRTSTRKMYRKGRHYRIYLPLGTLQRAAKGNILTGSAADIVTIYETYGYEALPQENGSDNSTGSAKKSENIDG
jgi:hypothetical protein